MVRGIPFLEITNKDMRFYRKYCLQNTKMEYNR